MQNGRISGDIGLASLCLSWQRVQIEEDNNMQIDFQPWFKFRSIQVLKQPNYLAYAYETTLHAADADGAPNAYSSLDLDKDCTHDAHVGLDCVRNAGYSSHPTTWWNKVLTPDPNDESKAYVHPAGPYKGFYVAQTDLRKPQGDLLCNCTFVDATEIPFAVTPTGFPSSQDGHVLAGQGDVGIATYLPTGKTTSFIIADSGGGPTAELGESSLALFGALGFPNANARTGAGLPQGPIQYIIFPNSRRPGKSIWPRAFADIDEQVRNLIKDTPGIHFIGA
jgi:hypothetical protein